MSRRVNPRQVSRLSRHPRDDGRDDGNGACDLERALGFPERRAGVGHVVDDADSFPLHDCPSRDAKETPHGFRPLGRRHARATVQGANILRSDQCRNHFARPAPRCGLRQERRRLEAHRPSAPPVRRDRNPDIYARRIESALDRIRQMVAQQSVQRETGLKMKDQRLQRSGVTTDANEMIESKRRLSDSTLRAPSVQQEMRAAVFPARLAIIAAEAMVQIL